MVANLASGSVGAEAPAQLEEIFADHGLRARIATPEPAELEAALTAAVGRDPDLLVVLAGDGTARAAAELAGSDGPPIAPLAGGTMNMLPYAVYGERPWAEALRDTLERGRVTALSGGEIEGRVFLVAAILGPAALWAPAREAARSGRLDRAWLRARLAWRRAFTGQLRYSLDGGPRGKTEALVLICPIASTVLDDDAEALEAEALNLNGAGEALRLGLNALVRDWRSDPAVDGRACTVARVWSPQGVPALLDGEAVRLNAVTEAQFRPAVCRVMAPRKAP